jgi:hypothetical protein
MLNFQDLQGEVKRRATRDQGGTQFDVATKNLINSSLFRISREAPWRCMRRTTRFNSVPSYTTGASYGYATVTSSSNIVNIPSGQLLTDGIDIRRQIKITGSSRYYYINAISGQENIILDKTWNASSSTGNNYEILPQAEYTLPMQAGHRMFMWHEDWGFPFKMQYITDQSFFEVAYFMTIKNVPTHYRMWGEDMAITQLRSASALSFVSSSTSDTTPKVIVFGNVAGYPDSEEVSLNGTTAVTTSNLFDSVERVAKNASTVGRITVTGNSGLTTVAVLPTGDTTAGVLYKKVFLYPLPVRQFVMNVNYYKDPFRLVGDDDIHELGQDFDEAIILLSVSKIKGETEQAGAGSFFSLWQDEMKSLRRTNMDKIDWFPKQHRPYGTGGQFVTPNLLYLQAGGNYGPASRR